MPPTVTSSTDWRPNRRTARAARGCEAGRSNCVADRRTKVETRGTYPAGSPIAARPAILLRAFGAEDRDRDRPPLRNVVPLDAGRDVVAETDGFGALCEGSFRTRFNQREAAVAMAQEVGSPGPVSQHGRGARHENEAWFLEARAGALWAA